MPEQQEPELDNGDQEEQIAATVEDVALRPGPNADDAADVEQELGSGLES